MTYSVPLKVTFRLFVYDKDPDTGVTVFAVSRKPAISRRPPAPVRARLERATHIGYLEPFDDERSAAQPLPR